MPYTEEECRELVCEALKIPKPVSAAGACRLVGAQFYGTPTIFRLPEDELETLHGVGQHIIEAFTAALLEGELDYAMARHGDVDVTRKRTQQVVCDRLDSLRKHTSERQIFDFAGDTIDAIIVAANAR